MTLKHLFIILSVFQLSINNIVAQQILSPDKNMVVTFSLSENEIPTYQVSYKNKIHIDHILLVQIIERK